MLTCKYLLFIKIVKSSLTTLQTYFLSKKKQFLLITLPLLYPFINKFFCAIVFPGFFNALKYIITP